MVVPNVESQERKKCPKKMEEGHNKIEMKSGGQAVVFNLDG